MTKQIVNIITTGGTIDKTYDEGDGSLALTGHAVETFLTSNLRLPHTELRVQRLMSKDSLYMTDADREAICAAIDQTRKTRAPIVVIHGTDTMTKSAEFCQKALPAIDVAVVFTGAMKPLEVRNTDATQNLTEALIAAQLLKPGFYIAFHNRVYEAGKVRKNRNTMTFELI